MNIFPVLIILAIFQNCQIKRTELISDLCKMTVISRITTHKNIFRCCGQNERQPYTPVSFKSPSRKMSRRYGMYYKSFFKYYLFIPIPFFNLVFIVSPGYKVCGGSKPRDHPFNLRFQLQNGFVIEMIPVIVGNY